MLITSMRHPYITCHEELGCLPHPTAPLVSPAVNSTNVWIRFPKFEEDQPYAVLFLRISNEAA